MKRHVFPFAVALAGVATCNAVQSGKVIAISSAAGLTLLTKVDGLEAGFTLEGYTLLNDGEIVRESFTPKT